MKIIYSSKFEREYRKLSVSVKGLAEIKEKIFRANPFDPSLETHKLKGKLSSFWVFSINKKFRIVFEFIDNNEVWFHSAGDHTIYSHWD